MPNRLNGASGGRSRTEKPEVAAGNVASHGDITESGRLAPGEGSHRGGLGFARRLPRGGAPARAARRSVCHPEQARTGNPPLRPRELAARERPAATSTRATRASSPSHRQRPIWHLRGSGKNALPEPPPTMMDGGVSEPSRALRVCFADGLRPPPLSEPLQQVTGHDRGRRRAPGRRAVLQRSTAT
jgi:hypothetical protein